MARLQVQTFTSRGVKVVGKGGDGNFRYIFVYGWQVQKRRKKTRQIYRWNEELEQSILKLPILPVIFILFFFFVCGWLWKRSKSCTLLHRAFLRQRFLDENCCQEKLESIHMNKQSWLVHQVKTCPKLAFDGVFQSNFPPLIAHLSDVTSEWNAPINMARLTLKASHFKPSDYIPIETTVADYRCKFKPAKTLLRGAAEQVSELVYGLLMIQNDNVC